MNSPSRVRRRSLNSSSPLTHKRDPHSSWSSGQDDPSKRLPSDLDRKLHHPWRPAKSDFHGHGCVDGRIKNFSRLDKARSFAKRDADHARNGGAKSYTSSSFPIKSEKQNVSGNGAVERVEMYRSPSLLRKGQDNLLMKKAGSLKSSNDDAQKGSSVPAFERHQVLAGERPCSKRTTVSSPDICTSTALGHGMYCETDRSLLKHRVGSDSYFEQSNHSIDYERDSFKRITKLKTRHASGKETPDMARSRVEEDKHIVCSLSKSNNGSSSDELLRKCSFSPAVCRNQKPLLSSSEEMPAETALPFLHVTRRARSERRRGKSCKLQTSIGVSLDGFCAELEEALLSKQEAESVSEEKLVAVMHKRVTDTGANAPVSSKARDAGVLADLNETHKVVPLEEADEREEGELEPEDEFTENHFSEVRNEVENGQLFEMQGESNSRECDYLEDGGSALDCQQWHSNPSSLNIRLSARDGCPDHMVLEVENSQRAFESGTTIRSEVMSREEQEVDVNGACIRVLDTVREDKKDFPAMDFNAAKSEDVGSILKAQQTDTILHAKDCCFSERIDPSLCVEPPTREILESHETYGQLCSTPFIGDEKHTDGKAHMRIIGCDIENPNVQVEKLDNQTDGDTHMRIKGSDNENPNVQVEKLDELTVYGHKQKRLKVGSLQLSLALPGCPLSSQVPQKPVEHEVSRPPDVLRPAQSLSHLRTETMSDGLTSSLSLSCLVHNPSCSLNCISHEEQELSCGGSRKILQRRWANSSGSDRGLCNVSKRMTSLLNITSNCTAEAPIYQQISQNDSNQAPSLMEKSISEWNQGKEVRSMSYVKLGLLEISSGPIAAMAQKLQELPDSFLQELKGLVKELLGSFAKREEFLVLQQIVRTRTDLTGQTLLHAHPTQLEILVALKTGMQSFVQQGAKTLTYKALIEIFLQTRCRNVDCQQFLPVDGCECKVCSEKEGFCHECMCMVCSKFDSDGNTCRWVGCDVCMHWCHTDCGLRMSHIKLTPVLCNGVEFYEMQLQCLSCHHYMELYGFVKSVFENFASTWGAETMARELDCVRRIFHGSEDGRGKQLCWKAEEMLQILERNVDVHDVCSSMLRFFNDGDTHVGKTCPVSLNSMQPSKGIDHVEGVKTAFATMSSIVARKLSNLVEHKEVEGKEMEGTKSLEKEDGRAGTSQDLHSIIGAKLTDVLIYQARADAAREDAINLQHIMTYKAKESEENYRVASAKLQVYEAEVQQRKRLQELQALERSHHEYERMKLQIESDMKHLMMKMERSKPQPW